MTSQNLVVGQTYTRAQAARLVGAGPWQGFFASKNREPVAIYGQQRFNPNQRQGTYALSRMDRPRSGPLCRRWVEGRVPVHVFWNDGKPGQWEYAGVWRPAATYTHGPLFDAQVAACRRRIPGHPVTMVVLTELVSS